MCVAWPVMSMVTIMSIVVAASMEGPMENGADDDKDRIEHPRAHNLLGEVYLVDVKVHGAM
jgi:hypothetical protein